MLHNIFILFLHTAGICSATLWAIRCGKEYALAWLVLLAVGMNLFVLKQISVFGLAVTASDSLAVGYLLTLNLIQEFFGREQAKKGVWIALFASLAFTGLSQLHLAYLPHPSDWAHALYTPLLRPMPRLFFASLITFLLVQAVDIALYGAMHKRWQGRYLPLRTTCALVCSQLLDTVLFSFLGLYGMVIQIGHILVWSLLLKGVVILLSIPFVSLCRGKRHDISL